MTLETMLFAIYSAIWVHAIISMLMFYKVYTVLINHEALLALSLKAYMEVNNITNITGTYKVGEVWSKNK